MTQIPTAEEFFRSYKEENSKSEGTISFNICEYARRFAKLHVEACKQEIANKSDGWYGAHHYDILKCYPLTNIK